MRQDRKKNGLIFVSSILQLMASFVLIAVGAFTSVFGFLKPSKLMDIKDIGFFVSQKGIIDIQLKLFNNKLLKTDFLFLALGIIIAVIGLIALVFACVKLNFVNKRKITRHKFAVLVFTLIPMAIAGCAITYLLLEWNILTDNIKYVLYGIGGVFALITLFNLLGIIVNRSEQFMSNDNNKYAFDNSSLRNARVEVNNNVRDAEAQPQRRLIATQVDNSQTNQPNRVMQPRPQNVQPRPQGVNMQARPQGVVRSAQVRPQQGLSRPTQSSQANVARPVAPNVQRPIQARPTNAPRPQVGARAQSTARPVSNIRASQVQNKYCTKCGKLIKAGETVCSVCGNKII